MFANISLFAIHNQKNVFVYLLLFIPIVIFYTLFTRFLTNIPYIDDFYWYFNFIDKFDQAPTFLEKVNVFLVPYNDHRHYLQRIVILLFFYLFDEINISFFIILGNIVFLLFIYNLFQFNLKNTFAIIFPMWLFFQPISFMNYYSFAFFNLPVLLFSLLCLRAMTQQANLSWIVFMGLLATFSNGNGLLVWIIGILISYNQANYRRLLVFSFILGILLVLFYLQNFYLQPTQIQVKTDRVIDVEFFIHLVLFFIQIHANFIDWFAYGIAWMAIPVGLIVLFLFGKILVNYTEDKNLSQLYIFYFLLFLSLSMVLISIGRSSMDGLIAYVAFHYRFYPCIFLGSILYYYTIVRKLKRSLQYGLVAVGIGITLLNYKVYLPLMYRHFNYQLADALSYSASRKWLFYPLIQGRKEYDFVNAISSAAVHNKSYVPFKPHISQGTSLLEKEVDSSQTITTLRANNTNYFPLLENAFFVVNCQGFTYYFPALFERSWKELIKFKFQQATVTAFVDWRTMYEPCLSQPSAIQLAVLRGNKLTFYPLSPEKENAVN